MRAAVLVQIVRNDPEIDAFLESEIAVGSFAGAAYAVGSVDDGITHESACGHAVSVPLRIAATPDTIWDCASLTKPLVTTTLVLQAVAEGRIQFDDAFHGFTYRELLTHTSGLDAWLPLYAMGDYLEAILAHGPSYPRGTKVVYSDLNFVLLWYALGEIYGDYVAAANERIFATLGIDARFRPPAELRPRIAATEWGQRHEVKMIAERKLAQPPLRQSLIWGEVHDGNSFGAGGTAGNAGLFATARDVFRIVQAFARGELVPPALVEAATRNYTPNLEEHRGLGWQMSYPTSPATSMLSPAAFGHTGFTGTSAWCDRGRIFVLLANRVHPCAAPVAMQKIRGRFHTLAMRLSP